MFGEVAVELVRELKTSQWLLPYNEVALRNVASEVKKIVDILLNMVAQKKKEMESTEVIAGVLFYHRSVQRNKRCALAYLYNRIERIKALRWESGGVLAADISTCMSGAERSFLAQYNQLLGAYCESVRLDLTAEIQPPKDLYIEVRVLEDCGNVLIDSGTVNLKTGTAHYLPRADIEHLIRQGALEHIT